MRDRSDDLYSGVPNKLQIVPVEVAPVDPLTQLVELLRPRALLWKHMVGQGDWAWEFPADSGVIFGRVVSGCCRFQLPGNAEQSLQPHRLNQGAATMIRTRFASSAGTSNSTPSIKNFSRHSCHRLCIFRRAVPATAGD